MEHRANMHNTGPADKPDHHPGDGFSPTLLGVSMSEPVGTDPASGGLAPQAGQRRRVDRVLDSAFVADLPAVPLAVLRERRAEASAEEGDLSYLRRLLHGRLDIIAAEIARRTDGDESPLVSRLTEILADAPSSRVASARYLPPGNGDATAGEYRVALEAELRELAVPDLANSPDEVLRDAAAALSGYEREVSDMRRRVQIVVDDCAAELGRRYREGEAAIDDLLVAESLPRAVAASTHRERRPENR